MRKKLVELTWIDIETHAGWHDEEDKPFIPMKAYGILVRKDQERYTLASGYDPENKKWSDKMHFPKGVVQHMRVIEEVDL